MKSLTTKVQAKLSQVDYLVMVAWVAIFSILVQGYQPFTSDHAIQIPFIRHLQDPSLYPGDPLIGTFQFYFSYFWVAMAHLLRYWELSRLFLLIHVAARVGFFYALYRLSLSIFASKAVAYLTLLSAVIPLATLGGTKYLSYGMAHQEAALPLLLLGISFFLQERPWAAFLASGLAFNLHPMLAFFTMFMLATSYIYDPKVITRSFLIQFVFFFLLPALPSVLWLTRSAVISGYLREEWVAVMRVRAGHHSFPSTWPLGAWVPFLIYISASLISLRSSPQCARKAVLLLVGVGVLCLLGTIFVEFFPVDVIAKAHSWRSTTLIVLVLLPFIVHYGFTAWRESNSVRRLAGLALLLALFFSDYLLLLASILFLVGFQQRSRCTIGRWALLTLAGSLALLWLAVGHPPLENLLPDIGHLGKTRLSELATIATLALGLLVSAMETARVTRVWTRLKRSYPLVSITLLFLAVAMWQVNRTGIIRYPRTGWIDVQLWARSHTPVDAIMIAPPYLTGFRAFSERVIVGEWKDGTAAYWEPSYASTWRHRMASLGADPLNYPSGQEAFAALRESYKGFSIQDFRRIAMDYGATYLVVEGPQYLPLQPLYNNGYFQVYDLGGQ